MFRSSTMIASAQPYTYFAHDDRVVRFPPLRQQSVCVGERTMDVSVQDYPNEQVRQYQPGRQICRSKTDAQFELPLDKQRGYHGITRRCKKLVSALFRIPGIECISLHRDRIAVTIGTAFRWVELEPQILQVLGNVLFGERVAIVYEYPERIRVIVDQPRNPHVMHFYTNRMLIKTTISHLMRAFDDVVVENELAEIGNLGKDLALQLMRIENVDQIFLHPYRLQITLIESAYWPNELVCQVRDIIIASIEAAAQVSS